MMRPKRISKPPTTYSELQVPPSRKNNKLQKKKAVGRAEFKPLPTAVPFEYTATPHLICGDIVLTEQNGIMSADMSMLSMVKEFKSILITENKGTKFVEVKIDPKANEIQPEPWRDLVSHLESQTTENLKDWAKIITEFSLTHEKLMQEMDERGGKLAKDEEQEKEFEKITKENEVIKDEVYAKYPSFCFRLKLANKLVRLTDILFNEMQIKDLGHSLDSFSSEVFDKGLPQIANYDSEMGSNLVKMMFMNYFDLTNSRFISPDTCISLKIKEDYTKNIYMRLYLLKNYEDGGLGIDLIFAIVRKEDVKMDTNGEKERTLNKNFIENMAKEEKIKADFLNDYYNSSITLRYTHHEKVCQVKEIPEMGEEKEEAMTMTPSSRS